MVLWFVCSLCRAELSKPLREKGQAAGLARSSIKKAVPNKMPDPKAIDREASMQKVSGAGGQGKGETPSGCNDGGCEGEERGRVTGTVLPSVTRPKCLRWGHGGRGRAKPWVGQETAPGESCQARTQPGSASGIRSLSNASRLGSVQCSFAGHSTKTTQGNTLTQEKYWLPEIMPPKAVRSLARSFLADWAWG